MNTPALMSDIKQEYHQQKYNNYLEIIDSPVQFAMEYNESSPDSSLVADSPAYYTPPIAHSEVPPQQISYSLSPQWNGQPAQLHNLSSPSPTSSGILYPQSPLSLQGGINPRSVSGSPPEHTLDQHQLYASTTFQGVFNTGPQTQVSSIETEITDSGEDEKSESPLSPSIDGDGDDSDYVYPPRNRSASGTRRSQSRSYVVPSQNPRVAVRALGGFERTPRSVRISIPVPVPNLTKKSRGRRVPTTSGVAVSPTGGEEEYAVLYMHCQGLWEMLRSW